MKTIGLLGGMSAESTIPYYRIINDTVRERLGGVHSARLILYSIEFAELEKMQQEGRWDDAGAMLADAARRLESAGAELMVICSNTMHLVADQVEAAITVPLIHIAGAIAAAVRQRGGKTPGLLGTRFTMERDFLTGRLQKLGLRILVPGEEDRKLVDRVIYSELVAGRFEDSSRVAYQSVIDRLVRDGADSIILGCTEIGLLIRDGDSPVPTFDTAAIHARAAALYALEQS
jgi:aspartate racemase